MRPTRGFLLLGLLFLAIGVLPAAAHRPDWGRGEITHIEDIQVSSAFYRELTAPGQVDAFTFHAASGEFLHTGIQIPKIAGLEHFGVSLALFGPGLPAVDESLHVALPAEHPEETGVILLPDAPGEDYFEPFTLTQYHGRQEINQTLPADGDYTLLVWRADGQTGKYVLDVGRREQFGVLDFLLFPVWWVQARLYFEQGSWLVLGLALMGLVVIYLLRRRLPR